jgi:hypothetical protein
MTFGSFLHWLDRCDHDWQPVRVIHREYTGWFQPLEGPLVTLVHWRCSRCDKLSVDEVSGWWRREDFE